MTGGIEDKIYGCLLGGAIGDALGAPFENWTYYQIRDEFGKADTFYAFEHPHADGKPGTITGDSVMRHYLALAITEHDGRVTPEEFAETLLAHLNPNRVWIAEEIMIKKLAVGMSPREVGRRMIPTSSATSAIPPIGIVNAADPRQAYRDGIDIASVLQDGINRDAAAAVAAGIARACSPNATSCDVLETIHEHASDPLIRRIELSIRVAEESATVDAFVEEFYSDLLDWTWPAVDWSVEKYQKGRVFSSNSLESLAAVVGILVLHGDDPNRAIVEAASFGRDCDAIGSIVGCIVGTLYGATVFRDSWITTCKNANTNFFRELYGKSDVNFETVGEQLHRGLENERHRTEMRAQELSDLLDNEV